MLCCHFIVSGALLQREEEARIRVEAAFFVGVVADAHPIRMGYGGIQHVQRVPCACVSGILSALPLPVHLCFDQLREEKLRLADERLRCCLALLFPLVFRLFDRDLMQFC